MWVYRGASLPNRLQLTIGVGFWLDYWLLLHADETHPAWSCRPLGLNSIAHMALAIRESLHDRALHRQLKLELKHAAPLTAYLPDFAFPADVASLSNAGTWSHEWIEWLESVLEKTREGKHVLTLLQALHTAMGANRFSDVAFLTRRLAAELADQGWSRRHLLSVVKAEFCDSGRFDGHTADSDMLESLQRILLAPSPKGFVIQAQLAPVPIGRSARNAFARGPSKLLTTFDESGESLLTGLTCKVRAPHPEQAASEAIELFGRTVELLRLRYYIGTHIYGTLRVLREPDEEIGNAPLPQPFWEPGSGRREVPQFPAQFDIFVKNFEPHVQNRWWAARWHLSQAFASWPESVHAAAAEVWQALEGFTHGIGPRSHKVVHLANSYLNGALPEAAEFLASRLTEQRRAMLMLLGDERRPINWYCWNPKQITIGKWLDRVLQPKSPNYYGNWRAPIPPKVLFDHAVGLLPALDRRMRTPSQETWMDLRLRGDLELLYGLRNRIVHQGSRIFSTRMAEYLGRVGVELLVTIMNQSKGRVKRRPV